MPACHAGGRGFESLPDRHFQNKKPHTKSSSEAAFGVWFLFLGYAIVGQRALMAGLADRMSVRREAQEARKRRLRDPQMMSWPLLP